MKFDRLSLVILLAVAGARLFPREPLLTNVLVLPFLIRVTLRMSAASFVNRRSSRSGAETGRELPKLA